jgi:hypothetical protein
VPNGAASLRIKRIRVIGHSNEHDSVHDHRRDFEVAGI